MGSLSSTMIPIAILSISSLLIGVTIASVITRETEIITTENDPAKLASEAVDEISAYIQIRDQKGKYYNINRDQKIEKGDQKIEKGDLRIEKIALLISPLVTHEFDVSCLTIQLCNEKAIRLLRYSGNSERLDSNSLFEHPIWDNLTGNNFGFISIIDSDRSLTACNILNDYSDNGYIVIRLPADMTMEYNDKIVVTLFPATGMEKTTILEAPPPLKQVVTFE